MHSNVSIKWEKVDKEPLPEPDTIVILKNNTNSLISSHQYTVSYSTGCESLEMLGYTL